MRQKSNRTKILERKEYAWLVGLNMFWFCFLTFLVDKDPIHGIDKIIYACMFAICFVLTLYGKSKTPRRNTLLY